MKPVYNKLNFSNAKIVETILSPINRIAELETGSSIESKELQVAESLSKLIAFSLGERNFMIDLASVDEVAFFKNPIEETNFNKFVKGVFVHNDEIIPLISLESIIGIDSCEPYSQMIIIEDEISSMKYAFGINFLYPILNIENLRNIVSTKFDEDSIINGVYLSDSSAYGLINHTNLNNLIRQLADEY